MFSSAQTVPFALQAGERPIGIRTFAGYVALAGLGNAAIAAFLLFRLPASHEPSLHSLLIRAFIYVVGAVLAGMGGARFYWNRSYASFGNVPPMSFRFFALVNATAWVWVPSIVLLSRQDSPASAALSALGAALLANGLRRILPSADSPHSQDRTPQPSERELFAATLHTAPRDAYGYVIAFCLYAGGYFLLNGFYLNAGAPLALAAFLFAWRLTLKPAPANSNFRAAYRLAAIAAAAVLITFFVLLDGIGHRNRVDAANLARARGQNQGGDVSGHPGTINGSGVSGYQSIILWPVPEKEQIVAPVPARLSPWATRAVRPLIIPFDGPYWFVQSPEISPGPTAHQARGTPTSVNIQASNARPISMAAHQSLSTPIPIARCRGIEVEIENYDNRAGAISVALLLSDGNSPKPQTLYLGQQPVPSTEPQHFSIKESPVFETLRFEVPPNAKIQRFSKMTVQFLPDIEHEFVAPKIAILQFRLIPR
ncbi:MAG TPA: hypothetical protein VMW15_02055 [Terracidiphilus sp.]|nr:hypothetical protein [Terracidiphilus sp.]